MLDNALIDLLATRLEAAVSSQASWVYPAPVNGVPPSGAAAYPVIQVDQPTQEGIPTSPAVFFERLFDDRYGWAESSLTYVDPATGWATGSFNVEEDQWMQTTFQVSAFVPQDPNNLALPTAGDVVSYVAQFIQSRLSRAYFKAQSVSMYRVGKVRNEWLKDERTLFEGRPNFDLVLNHKRSLIENVPATNIVEPAKVEGYSGAGVFPV